MSGTAVIGALELGLIYAFLALGIMISYRILGVADLTVEGSFTFGAVVAGLLTAEGHFALGLVGGVGAGMLAGITSGFFQTKLKIQPILAGILTMTGLYSINLMILGKPNLSLLGTTTLFSWVENLIKGSLVKVTASFILVVLIALFLSLFFKTQLGLSIRATGDNETMVRSSSINSDRIKIIGLGVSNAIVGLSGALVVQYQGYVDTNMGVGMVVVALASLIIGEVILGKKSVSRNIIAVIVGSVVYRFISAFVLAINFHPAAMKLISALIVVIAISIPTLKEKYQLEYKKRQQLKNLKDENHVKN